ncbi:MAG: energy transducer TonB [Acidobacteria bacterium]|nr:energy transducer TonB [Acidobacteriota bacterium]
MLALLLLTGPVVRTVPKLIDHGSIVLPSDLVKYQVTRTESGGGGGQRDDTPPQRGHLPKITPRPFVPPMAHMENARPVLAMEMAIFGNPSVIVPAINLPMVGDPGGVLGLISGGPGGPVGIGTGDRGGIGGKTGPGYGDGDRPGVGGYSPGFRDDVTQPTLLFKVEPEYTDEARKVRLQGTVLLRIVVDERGRAENIVVTQGLGLGLDERAIEAVKKWRFRPGMRASRPVPTTAIVQVTFRLL